MELSYLSLNTEECDHSISHNVPVQSQQSTFSVALEKSNLLFFLFSLKITILYTPNFDDSGVKAELL